AVRVIRDHDLQRIHDAHHAWHAHVQVVAHVVLEGRELRARWFAGDADRLGEIPDRFRRHTATSDAGDGRHPWIIPPADEPVVHEAQQLALAQDGVVQLEARELYLRRRMLESRLADKPIVDLAIVLELERA